MSLEFILSSRKMIAKFVIYQKADKWWTWQLENSEGISAMTLDSWQTQSECKKIVAIIKRSISRYTKIEIKL